MKSPQPVLIFYAPNVYQGGGKLLLLRAIKELSQRINLIAILNSNIKLDIEGLKLNNLEVCWIEGSLKGYASAEILLRAVAGNDLKVFCFHGIPPILCNSQKIYIYAQNKLIFERQNFIKTPKLSLIIFIQKAIYFLFSSKAQVIFVQTESMKLAIQSFLAPRRKQAPNILLTPFASFEATDIFENCTKFIKHDFIYPSSAFPHKNHIRLIEAWKILASDEIFPSLAIPLIRPDENLTNLVEETNIKFNTKIYILNELGHEDCLEEIYSSSALIYPSLSESYGLPLTEASLLNIPILASNLPYVFDSCNPFGVFNPESALSISLIVKEFLLKGKNNSHRQECKYNDKLFDMCNFLIT